MLDCRLRFFDDIIAVTTIYDSNASVGHGYDMGSSFPNFSSWVSYWETLQWYLTCAQGLDGFGHETDNVNSYLLF